MMEDEVDGQLTGDVLLGSSRQADTVPMRQSVHLCV
jgi:hypothetical protein